MYLEKIKVAGFKSFAQKTTLDFSDGMTAIVGPNGSGKSNIADAIRWVLGEQSMKTLRGKKSDDVIFAGTKAKGRMGVAEVTLVLNNENKKIPLEYKHIEITRRVFRDGEGEYLINKNKVRLLDIHELLAKAGFGQRTYGVVGQGMIDSLLKATPKELREMFYDACGVREFHLKKSISETKLSRTKTNLERGAELIQEIEPRVKSLERQAAKAQKKANLEKEKAEIRDVYFAHAYQFAVEQEDAVANELKSELKKEKEISAKIDAAEKRFEKATDDSFAIRREKLQAEMQQKNTALNELSRERMVLEGKIQIEKERTDSSHLKEIERQIKELTSEEKTLVSQQKDASQKGVQQERAIHALINEQEGIERNIKTVDQKIDAKRKEISSAGISVKQIDVQLSQVIDEQKDFAQYLHSAQKIEDIQKRFELSFERLEKLSKKIHRAHAGGELEKQLAEYVARKASFEKKALACAQKLQQHRMQKALAGQDKKRLDHEIASIQKKREALELRKKNEQQKKKDVAQIDHFLDEIAQIDKKITAIQKEIVVLEEKIDECKTQEKEHRNGIVEIERVFRSLNAELNEQKDFIRVLEGKEAQARMKTTAIYQHILEEIEQENVERYLAQLSKIEQSLSEKQVHEYGQRLKNIDASLLSLGDVDFEMLAEYEQAKKRYDFLVAQRDDLTEGQAALKKVIAELDGKIVSTFNASFDVISELFQKYFKVLFGGGDAILNKKYSTELTEAEELFDEVAKKKRELIIEIKVNPPGKKVSDLSMLSGGERAMASIALLMAIIESNPPPFIVLDEVDAALDEANSRRFAQILTHAVKKSQVLAITHNRATMSEASILYGVTMQESGISNVLSVKLSEARKIQKRRKKIVAKKAVQKQRA